MRESLFLKDFSDNPVGFGNFPASFIYAARLSRFSPVFPNKANFPATESRDTLTVLDVGVEMYELADETHTRVDVSLVRHVQLFRMICQA